MDKISYQKFYNCRIPYLFIPHGTTAICQMAFQRSSITALVIPNSITNIGMLALGPDNNIQDIYFCDTQEQWNSIPKNGNENFIAGKTIHYILDVTAVKILNTKGENIVGSSIQIEKDETHKFDIQLTFTNQGETLLDSRSVEWFCVVPNTPTNDINAVDTAVDAGDVIELTLITTNAAKSYSVALNVKALKSGNARIVGHVKKNPSSSMANNNDHVYAYYDVKVPGQESDTTSSSSNQENDPKDDPQKSDGYKKKGISTGAIVGIVVAVVVVVALAVVGVLIYLRRRKSYEPSADGEGGNNAPQENPSDPI